MATKIYLIASIALTLVSTSLTLALDEEASSSADLTNKGDSSSIAKRSASYRNTQFLACIKNYETGEYLYADNLNFARDSYRRRVYTWTRGVQPKNALWFFKSYGDVYHVRNMGYNEFMYAAHRALVYYRYLLTWIRDSPDDFQPDNQKYGWILEPYKDNNPPWGLVYIKNQYFEEYLATRDDHLRDNDRRYAIFTKDYNDKSFHAVWNITGCPHED